MIRLSRGCTIGGIETTLRIKELDLPTLLANAGSAVSREELMTRVWDENWFGSTKTLDVTMALLRARLATARQAALTERAPGDPRLTVVPHVTTLRGLGHRLDPGDVADRGPAPHDRPSHRA